MCEENLFVGCFHQRHVKLFCCQFLNVVYRRGSLTFEERVSYLTFHDFEGRMREISCIFQAQSVILYHNPATMLLVITKIPSMA